MPVTKAVTSTCSRASRSADKAESSQERELIRSALQAQGIPTAVYYPIPIHLSSAYSGHGHQKGDLPVSEDIANKIFSLPMHPYLEDDQIDRIVQIIEENSS